MGKKQTPKQRVTEYYTSIQYAICHGTVERLFSIRVNDKTVSVSPELTGMISDIDEPELFGGVRKEGGLSGRLAWQNGSNDQLLDAYVAEKKGTVPTNLPGYRGIATAFFTERLGAAQKGFYWSANQPVIPPVHFQVVRIDRSWLPDIAGIIDEGGAVSGEFDFSLTGGDIPPIFRAPSTIISQDYGYTLDASPSDVLRIFPAAPGRGENIASDPQNDGTWRWILSVVGNDDPATLMTWDATQGTSYPTAEQALAAAQAAGPWEISGYSKYRFWVNLEGSVALLANERGGLTADITVNRNRIDMNPGHIIRECLINRDWGLGFPESALDIETFESVAQTLFNESFGLSMIWTRQSEVEQFIGDVLSHIQGTLYVNPMSGKISLKLIRNDYNPSTLDLLDPSNCTVTNFKRRSPAEVTNEIAVTWTNPATEEEEVVTLQSLGSIVANNGEIVSDNRNYYGVRRSDLAARLCARDLGAATAPLATAEVNADRRFSRKVPGDVVKLTDPESGAFEIIMRVLKVDYGRPGDSRVQMSLTEDIFSYEQPRFVIPPTTQNPNASVPPTPPSSFEHMTANVFFSLNYDEGRDDLIDPETQALVLVATDNADVSNVDILLEETPISGGSIFENVGEFSVVGRVALSSELVAEVETETALPNPPFGSRPTVGGFAIIGPTGIPEENHEILFLRSLDAGTGAWTISRGALDTVPRDWPSGTPIRYFNLDDTVVVPEVLAEGILSDYKALTKTSLGVLAENKSPIVAYAPSERLYAPTRPANVTVAGVAFGVVNAKTLTSITVTWANRNRLTEDSFILRWDEASIDPEAGQTTTIRLIDQDTEVLIQEFTGLSGTSYTFPKSAFGTAPRIIVRALSVRGGLESIQGHSIVVDNGILTPPGNLSFEVF